MTWCNCKRCDPGVRYWCDPDDGHDWTACGSCLLFEQDQARGEVDEIADLPFIEFEVTL